MNENLINMEDQNFLAFLAKRYPYLYDVEMSVRKIQNATGFGEVNMVIKVERNFVEKASMVVVEDKLYRQRSGNVI